MLVAGLRARAIFATMILLAVLLPALPARAHLSPNSEIGLAVGREQIEAAIIIPLGELHFAEPALRDLRPGTLTAQDRARLSSYLSAHIGLRSPDGRPWRVAVEHIEITGMPSPDLKGTVRLTPPPGASPRRFSLRFDAVIDRVPNHFALVHIRHDFDDGRLSDQRGLLGGLRQGSTFVIVDLGGHSAWSGFVAAIRMGGHHIAEGHDHLLFLLVLLLAAPMRADAGRWRGYAGWRHSLRSLVAVITAFTVGHSITLIGGAFFAWRLPSQPVEILIALSILISAVHLWRPIFPGREAIVAAGFGLVHGLAFATIVGHIGLDRWQQALSILGFNIGIEIVQLLVIAAVMPALMLLAPTPRYPLIRNAVAGFAAVAAVAWIVERVTERPFAPAQWIDALLQHAPFAFAAIVIVSVTVLAVRRSISASRTY